MLWKNTAKEMLIEQAAELQKRIDKKVLAQWKFNYRAFKNNKIPVIPKKDPPYALHELNLEEEVRRKKMQKSFEYKYDVKNYYENYKQVQDSLKALYTTDLAVGVTPRSKQAKIRDEMDKINKLRQNINNLKLCTPLIEPEC